MEYKGGFKPNNQYGKRFSSEYQPKRNGRKKSVFKQIKAKCGLNADLISTEDFIKVLQTLMNLTPFQLKQIAGLDKKGADGKISVEKSEFPVWMVNIATALLSDVRYGRTRTLFYLFDVLFRRAANIDIAKIDVKINKSYFVQNNFNLSVLSTEELDVLNGLIDKMLNITPKYSPDYLTD